MERGNQLTIDHTWKSIQRKEKKFWKELIKNHLKPLQKDKNKEEKIQEDLICLRNRVSMFVYLLNAALVTAMFSLTQIDEFAEALKFQLTCLDRRVFITPIAVLFSVVFGLLLFIQFIGMLYHRFSTLIHISASTTIFESEKIRDSKRKSKILDILTSPESPDELAQRFNIESDKTRADLDRNRTVMEKYKDQYCSIQQVVDTNKTKLKFLRNTLTKWRNRALHHNANDWGNIIEGSRRLNNRVEPFPTTSTGVM